MNEFTGENADLNEVMQKRQARENTDTFDINAEYTPNNPFQLSVNTDTFAQSRAVTAPHEPPSGFATAKEEFKEWNTPYLAIHGIYENRSPNPIDDTPPAGWNPKTDPTKFVNVWPEYTPYLFAANGPKDLDVRLNHVMEEQNHRQTLQDGSLFYKLLGGIPGAIIDPLNLIPIIGEIKYAKFAPTVLKRMGMNLPGIFTYSTIHNAAVQNDKINGNLHDFFVDTAVDTMFGTAIFGGLAAAGLSVEKVNLFNLRGYAKEFLNGIDFKFHTNEKGQVLGIKAVDTSGNLSAARIDYAQQLADSSFSRSGIFKVPYLGATLYHSMTMKVIGTPLPKLLNHTLTSVRAITDRLVDHTIITKGLKEGETSPVKFETLMQREFADLRGLDVQLTALHMQMNGVDISNRIGTSAINKYNFLKESLKAPFNKIENSDHFTREQFDQKIEEVLFSEVSSEHAAVNEAAALLRPKIDNTYKAYRVAHNLPEDWVPPRTATGFLMRVYDTPYLNVNESKWTKAISNYLRDSDAIIESRMRPINDLDAQIEAHKIQHETLIRSTNKTDEEVSQSLERLNAYKGQKRSLEEQLQNELRDNPDLNLLTEDWSHLSAKEADALNQLTKRRDIVYKEIQEQKKFIADMKTKISKSKSQAMKAKTVETGKKQLRRSDIGKLSIEKEETKLRTLQKEHDDELQILQDKIANKEVNPRLYYKEKDSPVYKLRDPNQRLKFRDVYESHLHREQHAKAYYDTIMNQTNEDTINQVMGKITGNLSENPLKARTLMVPDKLLYDNGFMSKNLMAKVSNYTTYLARRTHIKSVFNDVTLDGGFAPVLEHVNQEYQAFREALNDKKVSLEAKLSEAESSSEKNKINKQIQKVDKEFAKNKKMFESAKEDLNHLYEKAMGISKMSKKAKMYYKGIMAVTSTSSLMLTPITMINDLSAMTLQHGIWPFIKDGVYPIVQSFGGLLKTKDSEALRKTAPSIHLALQDILSGWADKNWSMFTEPFYNAGKIVNVLDKIAHFSSNVTLTNYFDNMLQKIGGSMVQAEFMRILHAFKAGTMTEKEGLYLRKYGIDYEKWGDRMVTAFKKDGGGKTAIGGYKANFWQWQDLEAANEFSHAVFRGVKNTTIQRGLADSPFWADNALGALIHGFSGWTYASLNRYVIPSMQEADAQKLMGLIFMLSTGYLVSPMRRLAKGQDAFPKDQNDMQRLYETMQDSGYLSYYMNILADVNLLSGGTFFRDIKNDRYMDRTRTGLLGPAWGKANQMLDIVSAGASNEMNERDFKNMVHMIPILNASWLTGYSNHLIESLGLPKNRPEAHARKKYS